MDDNKAFDRRSFFKFGFLKGKEQAIKKIKEKVPRIGIRPPGAIEEEEFLLACTRCEDCVTACPHGVIFKAKYTESNIYGNTPFMDFSHKACEMCTDFPCITACKTGALLPNEELKKVGVAEVNREHCLVQQGQYCDYCLRSCPKEYNAISVDDKRMPVIDVEKCVGCGKCEYICVSMTGRAIEVVYKQEEDVHLKNATQTNGEEA